ncbi:MAG: tetratricopeptide repeat protein, partial [Pseudonocardiaceae bacterium]
YTAQAVTVLIETARRWPHIAQCQLFPLLREQPGLAMAAGGAAGGAALSRLADLPDVDIGVLEAIEALLPTGRHVDFDIAVAAITARLTQHRLAVTNDPADRGRLYATLGYRLAYAGRREEALGATGEAVETYRRLAGVNPAAFEPDLARALTNLGMMLSNLGRREEALGATVEAVESHRRLAGVNPAAFEPNLASGLWSFARVRAAGQVELPEALNAAGESVVSYERLVERLPQGVHQRSARRPRHLRRSTRPPGPRRRGSQGPPPDRPARKARVALVIPRVSGASRAGHSRAGSDGILIRK